MTDKRLSLLALSLLLATAADAGVERRGAAWVVTSPAGEASFDATSGALVGVRPKGHPGPLWRSGEFGLWSARLADRSVVNAAGPGVTCQAQAAGEQLVLTFDSPAVQVAVTVTGGPTGVDLGAVVTAKQQPVLEFGLPARLRFDPQQVERFVSPQAGGTAVGAAFNKRFFLPQSDAHPSGWRTEPSGGEGYQTLYGAGLDQRPDRVPLSALTVPAEGRPWLGDALAKRVATQTAVVNRGPAKGQADLVVIGSADGAWLSASHLGGRGYLWRLGGRVEEEQTGLALDAVGAVVSRLVATAPGGRAKIGLVALRRGPAAGGWAAVEVKAWRARFRAIPGAEVVELATPQAMLDAARDGGLRAILNPYGEQLPTAADHGMAAAIAAVGQYVKGGGNWFEVGGYPFFYGLRPLHWLQQHSEYPPAFADFFHLDTTAGSAAVYRVQPLGQAWDRREWFTPGRIACGGDEQGGWCERPFGVYVRPGTPWTSPAVRLQLGGDPVANLLAYRQANGMTRKLTDKVSPATWAKLKQGVMVFLAGSAEQKTEHLKELPPDTLIHYSDYLKGGFDKQYPDHLPPNPRFGTPAQLKQFQDQAHAQGLLVMPYTNPTWWCDEPKGPTFEKYGDAPLLRRLDGKLSFERYAANIGWTVCHWHPAVQEANRRTVTEFTKDYPVDVLFQDQCGARAWQYDLNPASPSATAYYQGLLSQVMEDAARVPLSTENGWDRVGEFETQLCGLSWGLVPTEGGPAWRRWLKEELPSDTWTIFPVVQALAHDKCMLLYHDLGQFVTTREVASWTLGLGFSMSYRAAAPALDRPAVKSWLGWLDRLQKSVCSRYLGQPLESFQHQRGAGEDAEGVIQARYGDVAVTANLDAKPVVVDGQPLAAFGFTAAAPGLLAGDLTKIGSQEFGAEGLHFVSQTRGAGAETWVWAPAGQAVTVPLPRPLPGAVQVTLDGAAPVPATGGATVSFTLPAGVDRRVQPPAELANRAPRDWPDGRPAVGVVDLGPGTHPSWTSIQPEQWTAALTAAKLPVQRLTTQAAVAAALQAGPRRWLAIVNPYGEGYPVAQAGQERATLRTIAAYVAAGGNWVETGGHSFHHALLPGGQSAPIGPAGAGELGLVVGGGAVEAPPDVLQVTSAGREWLGQELAQRVEKLASPVNRGLPRGAESPPFLALVAGPSDDFIGGYRLDGWGWLWRVGGFNPDPDVALPVIAAALRHVMDHPPHPPLLGRQRQLWHAVITAR